MGLPMGLLVVSYQGFLDIEYDYQIGNGLLDVDNVLTRRIFYLPKVLNVYRTQSSKAGRILLGIDEYLTLKSTRYFKNRSTNSVPFKHFRHFIHLCLSRSIRLIPDPKATFGSM